MTGEAEVVDRGDIIPENDAPAPAPAPEPELPKAETAPASESEPEQPRGEDGKFIPKGVFDNRLRSEREAREAAERRAAELEARLGQVSRAEDTQKLETEIAELEKSHAKLLLDGDHEKAAMAMRDIRLKERQIAVQEATHMSAQAKEQAREEMRMDLTIERIETKYDALNPNHDSYNQEMVDDVLGWQQILMQRDRLSPSAALAKAADKIMAAQARPAAAEAPKPGLGAAQSTTRATEQTQRNVATAKSQPPDMKDVGLDSDKAGYRGEVDVDKLTFEEFEALPEATKTKLRGDMV